MKPYYRGSYNEIPLSALNKTQRATVENLVRIAGEAAKIDEHGSWAFGIESDKKGYCEALNWDLYAFGQDCHSRKTLAIIQIRRFYRKKKGYFASIRKNYFLLGRNEDGTVFAHPVESAVIHSAIRRKVDPILAVQRWIFGFDYSRLLRQGDIALIPCSRRPSAPLLDRQSAVVNKTHLLEAEVLMENGELFAKKPHLRHIPGTHPEVQGDNKWYKVSVGQRADFWHFAAPTVD